MHCNTESAALQQIDVAGGRVVITYEINDNFVYIVENSLESSLLLITDYGVYMVSHAFIELKEVNQNISRNYDEPVELNSFKVRI